MIVSHEHSVDGDRCSSKRSRNKPAAIPIEVGIIDKESKKRWKALNRVRGHQNLAQSWISSDEFKEKTPDGNLLSSFFFPTLKFMQDLCGSGGWINQMDQAQFIIGPILGQDITTYLCMHICMYICI